jgi:circadian clock protein KaiC
LSRRSKSAAQRRRPVPSPEHSAAPQTRSGAAEPSNPYLEKTPTGIQGFDQITGGGLPKGRTAIVCGGPGSGKTMFGMEFLVRGARDFGDPGVLIAFEETPSDSSRNVASLGFDLPDLVRKGLIHVDYIHLEPSEIQETGDYDLEGLFVRLQHAVDTVGAKRVVLDTMEALFSSFDNPGLLRAEIRRLFRWLKDKGLTAVVTAEKGDGTLTRHGLEEYVSDCVILLDHRIHEQISTRRLRVVKYRGSAHGADEYPFLIEENGISILPVTSLALNHTVSLERVSTGIPDLDDMLEGKGFYRGTTVLVSGTAGTGKTTLAMQFADAACRRGETCLYIGLEESLDQVTRNSLSIGLDIRPWVEKGLLQHRAWRPSQYGMEMHLLRIQKLVDELKPANVVVDPVTDFASGSTETAVHAMMIRMVDFLKQNGITAILTNLIKGGQKSLEETEQGISTFVDTWILLRDIEQSGERNRCIYVLKARGIAHSNQLREYTMTSEGIRLQPAYVGPGGVFTGSARRAQEARDRGQQVERWQETDRRRQALERKRNAVEAKVAALRAEFAAEVLEAEELVAHAEERDRQLAADQDDRNRSRGVEPNGASAERAAAKVAEAE